MVRHFVEFLINDRVLPYNMTMFQAIRQFAMVRSVACHLVHVRVHDD